MSCRQKIYSKLVFLVFLILFSIFLLNYNIAPAGGSSTNPLTRFEIELLSKIVYLEARGESYEGKVAVLEVIKNRVASGLFPDTIAEVVSQPRQFSSYPLLHLAKMERECLKAVYDVFVKGITYLGNKVLYFCSHKFMTEQQIKNFAIQKIYVTTVGNHTFYAQKNH